jgi:hypothetical protein
MMPIPAAEFKAESGPKPGSITLLSDVCLRHVGAHLLKDEQEGRAATSERIRARQGGEG